MGFLATRFVPFALGQSRRAVRKYITLRKKRYISNGVLECSFTSLSIAHFRADYRVWRNKRFGEHVTALCEESVEIMVVRLCVCIV